MRFVQATWSNFCVFAILTVLVSVIDAGASYEIVCPNYYVPYFIDNRDGLLQMRCRQATCLNMNPSACRWTTGCQLNQFVHGFKYDSNTKLFKVHCCTHQLLEHTKFSPGLIPDLQPGDTVTDVEHNYVTQLITNVRRSPIPESYHLDFQRLRCPCYRGQITNLFSPGKKLEQYVYLASLGYGKASGCGDIFVGNYVQPNLGGGWAYYENSYGTYSGFADSYEHIGVWFVRRNILGSYADRRDDHGGNNEVVKHSEDNSNSSDEDDQNNVSGSGGNSIRSSHTGSSKSSSSSSGTRATSSHSSGYSKTSKVASKSTSNKVTNVHQTNGRNNSNGSKN